ncbi:3-hydroxyacyl-CoA dehydrogenase NAD-binding domain-containing protein [Asticcacaulis sp. 201]|uniref:3-hydroxyacyl-CoA dehydrogenase NAD-binding domain-containing protein n=1 Tax=Asticcacaulis sp. 201 TaxID=3028787 RepID=UPI00291604D4|nr:3-hydroxyacyl-CoA dehydrogenase NAD-binding domain-containing protein [Asticcacaulis sp. 201]MDV6330195.1 3-hydroxyacyl-CoA dehydrogenase NAD-binding domain-containing protein [Asticcacaulis sp. 201]
MENFKTDLDADGILLCTFDVPGKTMNTFTKSALADVEAIANRAKSEAEIKGVVITSGKTNGFCAGADLEELFGGGWEADGSLQGEDLLKATFDAAFEMNRVYRLLETCGKPVAVAINGLALGGGLELSLACHYRVLSNGPKVQVGLPEIKIGLFPGGGGSQRLPRLIGAQAALMAMSEGKSFKPAEALGAGVVDEVVDNDKVVEAAKTWIKTKGDPVQRWDKKDYKIPGGGPYHPAGAQVFIMGNALLRKQSYGNYPAVVNLMHSVYEGLQLPFDTAIKVETRYFAKTLMTPQAKAMLRTFFFSMQAIAKGSGRPAGVPKAEFTQVAVLGAGMMGAGIAYVQALAGIKTILIDRDQESADKGRKHCEDLLMKQVSRGKMTKEKMAETLDLIVATPDYDQIKGSELVIEAVFENTELKEKVTKDAEARLYSGDKADSAIFGSNTSTIPITILSTASQKPENFIGIHFFSPVDKMMLVEIILGKETSDETLAKAIDYVLKIRKTPIAVNDSRGFYTSRCFATFVAEGMALWADGYAPAIIDNVGRMTGMPRGPLEMNDDVALDLMVKVQAEMAKSQGDAYVPLAGEKEVADMVAKGRYGRKNGKGFYDYPAEKGASKTLWSGLSDYFTPTVTEAEPSDVAEIKTRLLYRQAVEAARCFEEGVITDPREADVGSILAWGFAPWSGGVISLIDSIGVAAFVTELDRLTKAYGPRFEPPKLLRDMAAKGETFYGRFGKDAKAGKAA